MIESFGSGTFGIDADAPFSYGKRDFFFLPGGVEDYKNRFGNLIVYVAPNMICGKVILRDIHDGYMGIDVFGGSHAQSTVGFSETYKSFIII